MGCWKMSKILKFEQIWAEIFKEYWRQVKIEISNFSGICDISFCFFIWKQNGSHLLLHASKFICLRHYNLNSMEQIDANQGWTLCQNDANWGWNLRWNDENLKLGEFSHIRGEPMARRREAHNIFVRRCIFFRLSAIFHV